MPRGRTVPDAAVEAKALPRYWQSHDITWISLFPANSMAAGVRPGVSGFEVEPYLRLGNLLYRVPG